MATVGVMNGTKLRLYVDQAGGSTYTAVGNSLDATLNYTHSPRETTNQDSAGNASFLEGKRSYTIDFNALHSEDGTNRFILWYDTLASSTLRGLVTFKFATATSGDVTLTGSGYITSLVNASGGAEANATFNGSIQGTGTLSKGTVTP
jgi:hypothetical protein